MGLIEGIRKIADQALLETDICGEWFPVVSDNWRRATASADNYVGDRLAALLERGIPIRVLRSIVRWLVRVGLDVTNDSTSSHVLLDLLGFCSTPLFGQDLHHYRPLMETREKKPLPLTTPIEEPNALAELVDAVETATPARLARILAEVRHRLAATICSPRSYREIAETVSNVRNAVFRRIARRAILASWTALGVPPDSNAVLYYRTIKTLDSDCDFIYEGPMPGEVVWRLARVLLRLGMKPDVPTALVVGRKLAQNDMKLLHLFFFDGHLLHFGDTDFVSGVRRRWADVRDRGDIWVSSAHPRLCAELAVWNGVSLPEGLRFEIARFDFRKLHYRAVTNLVFGLCTKYGVAGMDISGSDFWARLARATPGGERDVSTLKRAIALTIQARNLLQLRTGRRWAPAREDDLASVGALMSHQGVRQFMSTVRALGMALEEMRRRHFGDRVFPAAYGPPSEPGEQRWAEERTIDVYRQMASVP